MFTPYEHPSHPLLASSFEENKPMRLCKVFFLVSYALSGAIQNDGVLLQSTPFVLSAEEEQLLQRTDPRRVELARTMEASEISYLSDGLKIRGFAASPKSNGKFPVVIWNRGGNDKEGIWTRTQFAAYAGFLTAAGYSVLASNYRGAGGSEGKDEYGGADLDDVLNLIPLIQSFPKADGSRIALMGISRGGMMVFKALTRLQNVKAAVVTSPLTTLLGPPRQDHAEEEREMARMIPGFSKNREVVLRDRSPLFWADKVAAETPILLLSGTGDWRTDASVHVLSMAEALYKARRPFRLLLFEGGDHGLHEFRQERDQAVLVFLANYLRDGKKWPSLEPHGQ